MDKQNSSSNIHVPIRCLLYGTVRTFEEYYHLIKYYEMTDEISVCGLMASEAIYNELGGYKVMPKSEICAYIDAFDVVIILSKSTIAVQEITKELLAVGILDQFIIPCKALNILGFNFRKYIALKADTPSIIAPNCWGGFTYNSLGLRFNSPFINMFEKHEDYLKLLDDPKRYLETELELYKMEYEQNLKRDYPVAKCDDILLYFNHYTSFEEANEAWQRRLKRIRWDNLFIMFYDELPDRVDRFCNMPYQKKICFVPYKTKHENVVSIDLSDDLRPKTFGLFLNEIASRNYPYYDVLDLLLNGTITPLARFNT